MQAYKKLAIKYHPDKNPENKELAEENFKKVSEAYECLSSEEKRRTYDQFGKQGLNGAGGGGDGFSNERAEEIFSQFFGGQDPFSVLFGEMGGMGGGRGGGGGRMPGGAQFQFCSSGGPSGMGGMPPGMGGMGGMGGGMPEMMAQMMGGASHTLSSFRSSHAPFSPPQLPHPISTPDFHTRSFPPPLFVTAGMGGGGMGGMPGMMGGLPGMMGGLPGMMGGVPGMGMPGMGGMGTPGMGGMGGRGGGRRRREQPHVMPARTKVLLRGLQGAAHHNGKLGVVQDHDESSGRYTIQLEGGEQLRIKYENLLQMLAAEVTGMTRNEFNGRTAQVSNWDEERGRYHVKLPGEDGVAALQPQNLILPEGTRARVVGLQSQPQWNTRVGKITGFDRVKGRYTVQMTDEQRLSVKLENLLL